MYPHYKSTKASPSERMALKGRRKPVFRRTKPFSQTSQPAEVEEPYRLSYRYPSRGVLFTVTEPLLETAILHCSTSAQNLRFWARRRLRNRLLGRWCPRGWAGTNGGSLHQMALEADLGSPNKNTCHVQPCVCSQVQDMTQVRCKSPDPEHPIPYLLWCPVMCC